MNINDITYSAGDLLELGNHPFVLAIMIIAIIVCIAGAVFTVRETSFFAFGIAVPVVLGLGLLFVGGLLGHQYRVGEEVSEHLATVYGIADVPPNLTGSGQTSTFSRGDSYYSIEITSNGQVVVRDDTGRLVPPQDTDT